NTYHRRGNIRLYDAALKSQITAFHFAVLQFQPPTVAQRLGTGDPAVFKSNILAVPPQILPLSHTVADGDVFCVPERIFGIKNIVFINGVSYIVKGRFPLHPHVIQLRPGRTHHEIFTLYSTALHPVVLRWPAKLRGNDTASAYGNIP